MKRLEDGTGWLGFANDDLRVGRLALEGGIFNMACFHAQQAAEKSLKGLLKGKGKDIVRTHSLLELARSCAASGEPEPDMKEACRYLDRFYAATRYPDAFPGTLEDRMPAKHEAEKAMALAEGIYEKAWKALKEKE